MADFSKIHKKNVRFSVNRKFSLYVDVTESEKNLWLKLVSVLQARRNTGLQTDTFIYITKKYLNTPAVKIIGKAKAHDGFIRDKGILIKLSEEELAIWNERLTKHGGKKVNAFMDMINAEFTFQDTVKLINEK